MKLNSIIEIRCDGNSTIGYGHIRRCLTLKDELEECGFFVNIAPLTSSSFAIMGNNSVIGNPDLVIFDSPLNINSHIEAQNNRGVLTLALDYFGLIYPDINIVIYPHRPFGSKKLTYSGFEYVMIRKEILEAKKKHLRKTNQVNDFILVVIGGGDIRGQGKAIANFLSNRGFSVILVRGPVSIDNSVKQDNKYEVIYNPLNLPELLTTASLVVTNGGGTLFEAIHLQQSIYALPQSAEELKIVEYFFRKKLIQGYGIENISKFDFLNVARIEHPHAIDGLGAKRISRVIMDAFPTLLS